jgi:hypothetical protein
MSPRWDIATFVVALIAMFLAVSPTAVTVLEQALRRLNCLIWPARGRCRRLLWSDIHDGLLHLCDPRSCSHDIDQRNDSHSQTSCWDDTLGRAFNRTWYFINADSNITKYLVKKPDQLPLHEEYIKIDLQTLKAFLLLTIDACRTCETVDAVTLLQIQTFRGQVTAHLQPSGPVPINTHLTKFEIDRIIEGYPPFYRENFTTTGGIALPFPATDTNHIGRGAWILSVGMTTVSGPTPSLYNMQRVSHEKPDAYWRGTLVLRAFHMIDRTLAQLKEYENGQGGHPRTNPTKNAWSRDAQICFNMIMAPGYSLQPWALKKEQIERSNLFEAVVGDCPCYNTCISDSNHST